MLNHIHIKNFTIIDVLDLEIDTGMTVLTGETGAGKSIIIDALELALGGRADVNAIRHGSDRCEITITFDLQNIPGAQQWLTSHDLEVSQECIIRRSISTDGRSRSYINGQPFPLQLIREFGSLIISIHGQHEHQSLLKADEQRRLLDAYAGHNALVTQVATTFTQWHQTQTELTSLQTQVSERQARQELLGYQVQELDQLDLTENELSELDAEHKRLSNAEQLVENCQLALELCSTHDEQSAITLLNKAQAALEKIKEVDGKIANAAELLTNAIIQTQESANELRYYLDQIEINPERLSWIEQRLQNIHDMARKHRIAPLQLPALHQQLAAELQQLEGSDVRIQQLQQEIAQLAATYQEAASKLTKSRQTIAKKLSRLVTASMHTLGMPGGEFSIQFEKIERFTLHGLEQLKFMVTANPGQPLQPLNKVASGGELSRISLAIQVIIAESEITSTLVFDEVDVGIGGSTAAIVGALLRTLGETTQVLCVTHLPQVAAQGHHHLQVGKYTQNKTTFTQVKKLTKQEKIQEIARMLGGVKITPQTLAHAQEMLETA